MRRRRCCPALAERFTTDESGPETDAASGYRFPVGSPDFEAETARSD
ncbi:MAG: hypothetical protein ACTHQ3_04685 [Motilibacteraceae bacterium]